MKLFVDENNNNNSLCLNSSEKRKVFTFLKRKKAQNAKHIKMKKTSNAYFVFMYIYIFQMLKTIEARTFLYICAYKLFVVLPVSKSPASFHKVRKVSDQGYQVVRILRNVAEGACKK